MPTVPFEQSGPYYQAAVLGLRALEAQEGRGRRFGAEADARWNRFRGKLHDGDRLQMLLRDASAPWGVAFAASHVFRIDGVAEDEPFGPSWLVPNGAQARRYLSISDAPTLSAIAKVLGITEPPLAITDLRPTTQLVLAGAGAILGAAHAFEGRQDLDWARQVTIVADRPTHRQLAGLASLFVGAAKPCTVVASSLARIRPGTTAFVSADAEPECAAATAQRT